MTKIERSQRDHKILLALDRGTETQIQIAKRFNISHQRLQQIIKEYTYTKPKYDFIIIPLDVKIISKRKYLYLQILANIASKRLPCEARISIARILQENFNEYGGNTVEYIINLLKFKKIIEIKNNKIKDRGYKYRYHLTKNAIWLAKRELLNSIKELEDILLTLTNIQESDKCT